MNTMEKGCIGELKITIEAIAQGANVFKPCNPGSPIDIILCSKDGRLLRVQVKYRKLERNRIQVPLATVHNSEAVLIDKTKIDVFAVYNPENDKVFFVPIEEFMYVKTGKTFTVEYLERYKELKFLES